MNCARYEEWIYTFPEIEEEKQQELKRHIGQCPQCKHMFSEAEPIFQVIRKSKEEILPPPQLTDKVMAQLARKSQSGKIRKMYFSFLDLSFVRYSMAAVSVGILVLFCLEVMVPEIKSGSRGGPVTGIREVIIRSDEMRKSWSVQQEKKSRFEECRNKFNRQVDQACVQEKIRSYFKNNLSSVRLNLSKDI